MPIALITGASRGLGRALAEALGSRGWRLIADARDGAELSRAIAGLATPLTVTALPGDVSDPAHRRELIEAVRRTGRLDLLVNNASTLGPSPLPRLDHYPVDELTHVLDVNTVAPLALIQGVIDALTAARGTIVNITSDAAVEPYPGWGGYGASKAALDQVTAVLAAEFPAMRVYSFDPGDMRTVMHQQAYPGEDISDRPEPETVVPAFLRLIDERPPSGRYRAADLLVSVSEPR
jgi:NAD(P)-dependent dehydrogenase (short-subunit alcohol dehydrogenase family)